MAEISIKTILKDNRGWQFLVEISENESKTEHKVSMTSEFFNKITLEKDVKPKDIIKESFEFLLKREPKESILSEFDVTLISRYFPEYEKEIVKRL
jgi:hypothetical protein